MGTPSEILDGWEKYASGEADPSRSATERVSYLPVFEFEFRN